MEGIFGDLRGVFPIVLATDFLRYFIPASLAYLFFWILFSKKLEHRLVLGMWPENRNLIREFLYSMSTVVVFASVGFFVYEGNRHGYFKIYGEVTKYGSVYFWLSLPLMVIVHDAYFYWTHRLMHQRALFKYFHRVHHLSKNPSPWAAYAFGPLEAVVQAVFFPLYVFFVPTHGIVLFLFLTHMILRNVFGHLSIELYPSGFSAHRFWGWITTTTHHSIHHRSARSNYGIYFTFWDRIMGTTDPEYHDLYEKIASTCPVRPGTS